MQDYKIHGTTIFIKGNEIISQYKVHGNEVSKIVEHHSGNEWDEWIVPFYTFGDIQTNTEQILLNKLHEQGEL